VDLNAVVQSLMRCSGFIRYWRKSVSTLGHYFTYLL